MSLDFILEWSATLLSLIFLIGIIQRKVWAWPAGTLSSALSVVLFFRIGLYAETGLYIFYVVMGFYGWSQWRKNTSEAKVALVDISLKTQLLALLGIPLAMILGYGLNALPGVSFAYFDAFTTVFGLWATWQESRRIRTAFHYWIPLNIASVVLYGAKGLWVYAVLMIIYSVMSVVGFIRWRK
ncbi:MAG: nicotinamide riboside transporter PnuC [Bacteroidetes bacterium]|jgi:nicotinamide mononucleotide transporter|nr:nicotinamide riboside transporter PnuC [Bacteroidota bacterium]MDA9791558.1 nicotinamide riboside transporter PnuC [Schleiferiaceae bacterium]MDA9946116.1 nicotinamide riboside transporter PnuC [Schleiferiaceae bacterium]MDB2627404.1 nicotinamide riboside transporter PnuC [Schleiferiaceae bacterium]MDB9928954.1 nicotinamide riboside transporter PnuC [Schleiferiaceae bacterium]